MKLFIERASKGISAVAEYDPENKRFVVLKGSKVSEDVSSAPTFRGANAIRILRNKYVVDREVTEDVSFRSSSTAGNFVTGSSTDGPGTWRSENGEKLKSILSETKE